MANTLSSTFSKLFLYPFCLGPDVCYLKICGHLGAREQAQGFYTVSCNNNKQVYEDETWLLLITNPFSMAIKNTTQLTNSRFHTYTYQEYFHHSEANLDVIISLNRRLLLISFTFLKFCLFNYIYKTFVFCNSRIISVVNFIYVCLSKVIP